MNRTRDACAPGAERKAVTTFDVDQIRRDFPILGETVHGKPLVYLDNAATAQKPRAVIDAISGFYETSNSNVHRGLHQLSERATAAYEGSRAKLRRFLNAADDREIIFVRGTTEAINLVAGSYGRTHVGEGDEVVITAMEHHSNIVPWQLLCDEKKARLRVVPVNDAGEVDMEAFESIVGPRTRFVSVVHMSNALGTINPVRRIADLAHRHGAPVLLDGAQSAPHLKVDVQELDCDFFTLSGHKLYGPTGIGVLYGRAELLDKMPPYQGGGDMIRSVTFEKTLFNRIPYKFEAGTPNIAGAIGLGVAVDYVQGLDAAARGEYERDLLAYATDAIASVPKVRIIGTAREKASIISFVLEDVHPHDVGSILDHEGIAIRAGHHCTQPLMERFGVPATARASMTFYNTRQEVDALVDGISKVFKVFSG